MSSNLPPPASPPPPWNCPRQAAGSESVTNARAHRDPPAPGCWRCRVPAHLLSAALPARVCPVLQFGLLSPAPWWRRHEDANCVLVCGQCWASFWTWDRLPSKPALPGTESEPTQVLHALLLGVRSLEPLGPSRPVSPFPGTQPPPPPLSGAS